MTREEKIERKIIMGLDRLVRDEEVELGKTRRRRSNCYRLGFFVAGVAVYVALQRWWPAWTTALVGALGGLGIGLGALYDNSINQWPVLKPFIDSQKLAEAASRFHP